MTEYKVHPVELSYWVRQNDPRVCPVPGKPIFTNPPKVPATSTGIDGSGETETRVVTLWDRERGGLREAGHTAMASAQKSPLRVPLA